VYHYSISFLFILRSQISYKCQAFEGVCDDSKLVVPRIFHRRYRPPWLSFPCKLDPTSCCTSRSISRAIPPSNLCPQSLHWQCQRCQARKHYHLGQRFAAYSFCCTQWRSSHWSCTHLLCFHFWLHPLILISSFPAPAISRNLIWPGHYHSIWEPDWYPWSLYAHTQVNKILTFFSVTTRTAVSAHWRLREWSRGHSAHLAAVNCAH